MNKGDKVVLSNKVRHAEFAGLTGTIQRIIKSRGIVVVLCDNGKRYDAFPENIKLI